MERLDCIKVMHSDALMSRRSAKKSQKCPRITISLSPQDHEQVTRMAKTKKVSASWIVRDAVEKYLTADIPLLASVSGKDL
jgi:hypothetical protein